MGGVALFARKRVALAGAVAALVATAALLGGVFHDASSAGPRAAALAQVRTDAALGGGFSAGDTAGLIRQLQEALQANPRDAQSYALLGLAYQQRARETGDPTY